jgi:hypothetical protein
MSTEKHGPLEFATVHDVTAAFTGRRRLDRPSSGLLRGLIFARRRTGARHVVVFPHDSH